MKWISVVCILLLSLKVESALTPEAQTYLNKIPERKLTLPYVIKVALLNASAYKIIGLNYMTADLEKQAKIDPQTDTYLTGGTNYTDDNSAKTNGFQPARSKQFNWNLGVAKSWSSGTTTSLNWFQESNNLEFANLGPGFGNVFITNYKQSVASVNIEQKLLKDSFGYALRKREQATEARSDSIKWQSRDQFETATIEIINLFYNAWLLQEQVKSLTEQVERQKKLVKIMTRRARKGAVEKPDLIQIEALLASLKTRLSQVRASLDYQWDNLVIQLKLPKSFLAIDPMDVPTAIDNPVPLGIRVCGQKEPSKTAAVFTLEKQLEGLDADFQASKNESLPDLKLVAGYQGNSIDGSAGTNFDNVMRGRVNNGFGLGPSWTVGLKLEFPLDNSAARAERAKNFISREQVSTQLISEVDNLKTRWRKACRDLKTEWENSKIYQNVVLEQKKRVKAQDRRFRLGRVSVNELVVAEDDLGSWQFQNQQKAVQVRLLAWQVQQYSGELYRQLSPYVQQRLKEAQEL